MTVKLILCDRDGVLLNHVNPYILRWSEVRPVPGALPAIATIQRMGLPVVVVSNQSPIGRGLILPAFVDEVNRHLASVIRGYGGQPPRFYVCPHTPTDGCQCRKPKPGLLRTAARDHGTAIGDSWMVGDSDTDLEAGSRAGCDRLIHVRSGRQATAAPLATDTVTDLSELPSLLRSELRGG